MTLDLTTKQRLFIREYLKTGNATEAAMKVYDCKDRESAASVGWETLRKLDIAELMEEKGLTDSRILDSLEEGLRATRIKTSLTEPDKIENDYATRHKYLETAIKLKGKLIERTDVTSGGEKIETNTIVFTNFADETKS